MPIISRSNSFTSVSSLLSADDISLPETVSLYSPHPCSHLMPLTPVVSDSMRPRITNLPRGSRDRSYSPQFSNQPEIDSSMFSYITEGDSYDFLASVRAADVNFSSGSSICSISLQPLTYQDKPCILYASVDGQHVAGFYSYDNLAAWISQSGTHPLTRVPATWDDSFILMCRKIIP